MNWWPLVWFVVIVIACVIEKLLPSRFAICSAFPAFVCIFLSLINVKYIVQIITFIILTIIILAVGRHSIIKALYLLNNAKKGTSLVGRQFTLTKGISFGSAGRVKIDGNIWTAYADGEYEISLGEIVEVVEVKGLHVIVRSA